jgi:hypothetical protein
MTRFSSARSQPRAATRLGRIQPAARRVALPLLLVVPVLVAACGSVAAPAAGPAGTKNATGTHAAGHSSSPQHFTRVKNGTAQPKTVAAVCRDPRAVSHVGIKAVGLSRMGVLQPRVRPRYDWVITNPARASALASSACGLPLMPRVTNCPDLTRGTYKLTFSAAGTQFPVVTVQVTGCMEAIGLGTPRSAARANAGSFWSLLRADTSSPPPDGIPPTS